MSTGVTQPSPDGYRAKEFDGRHLALFFLIAFGWSWLWWGLFVFHLLSFPAGAGTSEVDVRSAAPKLLLLAITPFGPTIGAFVVTAMTKGRAGASRLWHRFWSRNQSIGWLLVALTIFPLMRLGANLVARTLDGQPYPYFEDSWLAVFLVGFFFNAFINGGMSEEFGWRGYVLPHFQAKWNALVSSVLLGIIWASWHIPLWFIPGEQHQQTFFLSFAANLIAFSIMMTWIFNNTNGSILATIVFHGAANASSDLVWCCGSSVWHLYGVHVFVAVVIVVIFGPKTLVGRGLRIRSSIDRVKA